MMEDFRVPFKDLRDAAIAVPGIKRILLDPGIAHNQAVFDILVFHYQTSERSVRRWRKSHVPRDAESAFAGEPLTEDVGTGMDIGDIVQVDPNWAGFTEPDRANIHDKLNTALNAVDANPEDVVGLRVSQYQTVTKDADGEAHVHDLYAVKLLVKTKDVTPGWPVVQPASPAVVQAVKSTARRPKHAEQVAVILPDPQIGYRHYIDSGEFDPFHDEAALDVALQIVRDVDPNLVLCLGDFLDLPAFGRYEQEQAFAATTQKSVDRGHRFLAQIRASAPESEIVVLEGNHDRRLQNMIVNNAKAAFGLQRAGDVSGWPVLSVPYLCAFDSLNVQYVEGYPAGQYWINDNLRAIHGTKVRSSQSTAAAVVKDDDVSTLFGHIHRIETEFLTRQNRSGGKTLVAHTPGCLCRIDGAVPSVKGSTDLLGRPIESFENWVQGLSVISYASGNGAFSINSLFIDTMRGHRCAFNGKVYLPNDTPEF
jgi:predicted phosphodiesterase